jgi:Kae1-associated kinase Bud32
MNEKIISSGAEAIIIKNSNNSIIKKRIEKKYRISEIDLKLRKSRTKREAKILQKLQDIISVPKLIDVNDKEMTIEMEYINGYKIRDCLDNDYKKIIKEIAKNIAIMHNENIIHGDLTTSNMILYNKNVYFIDFGLSFVSHKIEDKAVDLHLFRQALESKHFKVWEDAFKIFIKEYEKHSEKNTEIIKRLNIVEERGRNKGK